MPVETLLPNAAGDFAENSVQGAGGVNYVALSDNTDSTYIVTPGAGDHEDAVNLQAPSSITGSDTIDSIDIRFRARSESTADGSVTVGLRLSGTNSLASAQTSIPVSATNYTKTNIARPGGGSWTFADLADLQAILVLNEGSASAVRVFEVWVDVNYTVGGGGGDGGGNGTVEVLGTTWDAQDNPFTATADRPTGVSEGDLLLAIQTSDSDFGSLSDMQAPAGWTEIDSYVNTAAGAMKVWQKIAGASEPTTYAFPDGSGAYGTVVVLALRGQDPTTPLAATPNFDDGGSATAANHPAPSVTGVAGGVLVTAHYAEIDGTDRAYTPPSGMTEQAEAKTAVDPWTVLEVCTKALTADGATGVQSAVLSASAQWITMALVVNPAPVPSTGGAGAGFLSLL